MAPPDVDVLEKIVEENKMKYLYVFMFGFPTSKIVVSKTEKMKSLFHYLKMSFPQCNKINNKNVLLFSSYLIYCIIYFILFSVT